MKKIEITREEDGFIVDSWQKIIEDHDEEAYLNAFIKWSESNGTQVRKIGQSTVGHWGYGIFFQRNYLDSNILEEIEQFL